MVIIILNENPLFTIITKNIYKNYDKILKKSKKYIRMSDKNLRKTNGVRFVYLYSLNFKEEDNKKK